MPGGNKKNEATVQETNDSSILSKASIVNLNYFNDPYLKIFTTRPVRRAPLIHWGYYVRAKSIDYTLQRFLSMNQSEERIQIISLGAGFDSSYFRLKKEKLLKNCIYYEIDFPEVIKRKLCIIEKHEELKNLIGQYKVKDECLTSDDYNVIPCDLTKTNILKEYFSKCKLDYNVPTLLFSECVLTYVEYEESHKLLKWIACQFENVIISIYEQILPNDAFGQVMLKHFDKIQSSLKRIHNLQTIKDHENEFINSGFELASGFDMNYFFDHYISLEEQERIKKLEVFDEFEEWHLKCKHYCLVTALKGTNCQTTREELFPNLLTTIAMTDNNDGISAKLSPYKVSGDDTCQRFGHCCTKINQQQYLITGGFGVSATGTHEKLKCASILNDLNNEIQCELINTDIKRLHHSVTHISDGRIFIFGGRLSPMKPCKEFVVCNVNDGKVEALLTKDVDAKLLRWRHTATYHKGKVYVFGGRGVGERVLNDLWCYDIVTDMWKQQTLSLDLNGRHSHSMNVYEDNLILYGGLTHDIKILNECVKISISGSNHNNDHVLVVNHIQSAVALPFRYSHTSHIKNDNLIIVGGIDLSATTDNSIIVFSMITSHWKMVKVSSSTDLMYPLMLHNHCSILQNEVDNQQNEESLLILGGGGNCFSFGTYFNIQPTVIKWSMVT